MDTDLPHTLQDDMESLMYVVMYCSLRWLPHNLSTEKLAATIHAMFADADEEIYDPKFGLTGGSGKVGNQGTRRWTKKIVWDGPIHNWLNAVMDLNYNIMKAFKWMPDLWSDPTHLEVFWSTFLRNNTLPPADRMEHPKPVPVQNNEGQTMTCMITPLPASSSLGKRSSPQADCSTAEEPQSKCPKVLGLFRMSTDAGGLPPPPPPSPRRLRRRGPDGRTLRPKKGDERRSGPARETTPQSSKSSNIPRSRQRRTC